MPEITRFYGIVIKMYLKPKEHDPKHIHAIYGDYLGVFNIETFEMTNGDLPNRAKRIVQEWIQMYKNELIKMWDTQNIYHLPPLK